MFSPKTDYLCITNDEIVQNSKSKLKNSHSCVPLKVLSVGLDLHESGTTG